MQTVFLFLKNFLFISDLLKTKYIEYLAGKYRVVIFSNAISEEAIARGDYFSSPNVHYVSWKVQNPKLFGVFKFLRMACLHELDFLPAMKIYYQSRPFRQDKRARLLRFLSWPFAKLSTIRNFTWLETLFTRQSPMFEKYCRQYRPSLVITATPGVQVFDAEAIILAKKMGIPTLATNFSWDNLTAFKSVRLRFPDYLFAWNEMIRRSAIDLHRFPADRIFVTGSVRFDKYFDDLHPIPSREEFLHSKRLNPENKTILFATVASGNCSHQPKVIENLLEARREKKIPYVNFLIRLHPFDQSIHYEKFRDLPDVCVEAAGREVKNQAGERRVEMDRADFINLKATLRYTDININYKSTISVESLAFDKPVINFLDPTAPFQNRYYYEEGSYYYPLVKAGAVMVAKDDEDLLKSIREYLADPAKDSSARRKIASEFFGFTDGFSWKRNVDYLEKLLKN